MNTATATDTNKHTVTDVKISEIIIPENRHRALVPQRIPVLMESIGVLGLLHPIVITPEKKLLAGLHRITTCSQMGWETIPANIKTYDEIDAELAEIDENLLKFELTVAERSSQIARRNELWKQKYADADEDDIDTSEWESTGEAEVDNDKPKPTTTAFIKDTALKTGRSTTTIRDEANLGKKLNELLSPEVRELIEPTKVANVKRELERLLEISDPDDILEVATKINESYKADPKHQLDVRGALAEIGKGTTYEATVSQDGSATLDKSLQRVRSILQASVEKPEFATEAETWTSEGLMKVRDDFFELEKSVQKGITILTDILDKNAKLGR